MEKTKSISLILGVLTMSIFVGCLVFAWTEPPYGGTCTNPPCPPGGNVPAPLNVSLNAQSKEGALVIGTNSGLTTGLIVQYGNIGIGTTAPGAKLDVQVSAGSDAVKINTFKLRPISATEMGVYDSGGNQVLIFDEGL
jgi:hypothetical protein